MQQVATRPTTVVRNAANEATVRCPGLRQNRTALIASASPLPDRPKGICRDLSTLSERRPDFCQCACHEHLLSADGIGESSDPVRSRIGFAFIQLARTQI